VSGSIVDRPWDGGRSSPALSTLVLRGTGAYCESVGRVEGDSMELHEVRVGWRSGGVVPVTERIGGGGRSSTSTAFRARRGADDEENALWRWRSGCCALL
jgi:hypothetical protein